jgi:hypothetical protein
MIKDFIMRFFQNSAMVLTMYFCIFISNRANADILWSKDLIFDSNTNSTPLASCINKDANGVIVITKTGPKGSFLTKGYYDCVLWELGFQGEILRRTLIKDIDSKTIQTNAVTAGPGGIMASDSDGNLLTIGMLGEQRKEKSLSIVSTASAAEPNVIKNSRIEEFSISKLISLPNNTHILIGGQNSYGAYWRIDNQGKIIKEKTFKHGGQERFTGADSIKSHDSNFVVVGLSAKMKGKMNFEGSTENFILVYDVNDNLIHEDYFAGGDSISILPKVCSLNDGNIVTVFYKKQDPNSKAGLWARRYTSELKMLWEKEIYPIDISIFSFDIISSGSDNFVIAILTSKEGLKIYTFGEEGHKIEYNEYKGMVGIPGFNIMRMNNRTIIVFEEGSAGNIKELTIKAKVVALD